MLLLIVKNNSGFWPGGFRELNRKSRLDVSYFSPADLLQIASIAGAIAKAQCFSDR
jgi:hypothetical protein